MFDKLRCDYKNDGFRLGSVLKETVFQQPTVYNNFAAAYVVIACVPRSEGSIELRVTSIMVLLDPKRWMRKLTGKINMENEKDQEHYHVGLRWWREKFRFCRVKGREKVPPLKTGCQPVYSVTGYAKCI